MTVCHRTQKDLKEDYEKYGSNYKFNCWCCGKEFYAFYPLTRYCGYRCRNDAYIKRRKEYKTALRNKVCIVCNTNFQAKHIDTIYCSNKCKQKHYRVTKTSCPKFRQTDLSNKA